MYILTVDQMRQAEASADAEGQTYELMMESAGQAVATAVRQINHPEGLRVLVLVGPGNNGGDGLVAAYHLVRMGANVACYIWKREIAEDANLIRATESGCRIIRADEDGAHVRLSREAEEADIVLDALLGTGTTRPIDGALADLLDLVGETTRRRREHRLPWSKEALQIVDPTVKMPQRPETPMIVAVDAPSGVNCDTGAVDPHTLNADLTVTFGFPKLGHFSFPGAATIGKLLVAEIGIAPRLVTDCYVKLVTSQMVTEKLPARPMDAHKGTFGKALIIAGSVNYTGAPALAAIAAMRAGAGLVTLALGESIFPIVAGKLLEPTYILLPESTGVISPDAIKVLNGQITNYQALLIGPGMGQDKEVTRFVQQLLASAGTATAKHTRIGFMAGETPDENVDKVGQDKSAPPMVIDADALNALATEEEWWNRVPAGGILTPHPGEMARLTRCTCDEVQADRIEVARQAAMGWNQIVVLKGAHTVIADPVGDVFILPFANPILASAGTGDVLAGAIAGLLAQGLTPLDAAIVGAFVHGMAAEEVEFSRNMSCGAVAGDLAACIPIAIQRLRT